MSAVGPLQTSSGAKGRREADILTACTWSVVTYELFFSRAGRRSDMDSKPPRPPAEELCVFFFFHCFSRLNLGLLIIQSFELEDNNKNFREAE